MEYLAFYKEQYYKEFERKNEITNSFSVPIGILSGLAAALFYFFISFDFTFPVIWVLIFVFLALVSLVLLGISIYFVSKGMLNIIGGYGYVYLPFAKELDNYQKELKEYYAQVNVLDNTDKDFEDAIIVELIQCNTTNKLNNDVKSEYRLRCLEFTLFSLISIAVLAILSVGSIQNQKGQQVISKVKIEPMLNLNLQTKQNPKKIDSFANKILNNGRR